MNDTSVSTQTDFASTLTDNSPSYAGFWRRWMAALIDQIVLLPVTYVAGELLSLARITDFISIFALNTLITMTYKIIFESSEMKGTPGKNILGLCIVSETTLQRISFKAAVLRYVSSIISGLLLGMGYLIQPFTEKRQTLHDILAKTVVIKKDISGLNYFTVFKNNFRTVINN